MTTGTIGGAVGTTHFYDFASAANATSQPSAEMSIPARALPIRPCNSTTIRLPVRPTSQITAPLREQGTGGAELDFLDTSTAGSATIVNNGSPNGGGNGGLTVFSNIAKAGTANITNNAATIAGPATSAAATPTSIAARAPTTPPSSPMAPCFTSASVPTPAIRSSMPRFDCRPWNSSTATGQRPARGKAARSSFTPARQPAMARSPITRHGRKGCGAHHT